MSVQKFVRLATTLEDHEKFYTRLPFSSQTLMSLQIQQEELKLLWEKTRNCFEESVEEAERVSDENGDGYDVLRDRYEEVFQAYMRSASKIDEAIKLLSTNNHCAVNSTMVPPPMTSVANTQHYPTPQTPTQQVINLGIPVPPCDTGVFSGNYSDWPAFRDLFTAIFINNKSLPDVLKLYHLIQKTEGEAKEIVSKFPLTNEGFNLSWTALTDRFENKRILIHSELRTLFNIKPIERESGEGIKNLQRTINNCRSSLKLHGIKVDEWDAVFTYLCSTKLPENTLSLWEHSLADKKRIPKWQEIEEFLTRRFQTLETVYDFRTGPEYNLPYNNNNSLSENNSRVARRVSSLATNVSLPECRLCSNQKHFLRSCPKFLSMNCTARMDYVLTQKLCLNCLGSGHDRQRCRSVFRCSICKQRHHSLLHVDTEATETVSPSSQPRSSQSGENINLISLFTRTDKSVLLGTAMIKLGTGNDAITARALIDSGSEASFISDRLRRRMNLPTTSIKAQISGLNSTVSAEARKACRIIISSHCNVDFVLQADVIVVPKLTENLPSVDISPDTIGNLPKIPLADVNFFHSQQIDVLLGADIYPAIILEGVRKHFWGNVIAQETVFGWILTGQVASISREPRNVVTYFNEVSLDRQLRKFWELEEVSTGTCSNPEDIWCEEYYRKTTKRAPNGRYIVSLPFKPLNVHTQRLGESRNRALQQLMRQELNLAKRPDIKSAYDEVLKEYITLGHMKRVYPTSSPSSYDSFYLPHHAVMKAESTSTKLRVVFNASCKTSNGQSLNDVLHSGPVLQADLTSLILKWRFFKYVLSGDIEKMYRQILVDRSQTQYQRILFRPSPQDTVQDFELQTVTFGVNCAPYLAIRTLHELAHDVSETYPMVSKILRENMYVDDAIVGAHTIENAVEIRKDLGKVLETAGFKIKKWAANSKGILKDVPKEDLLREDFLDFDESSLTKTLGVRWNAKNDEFFFRVPSIDIKEAYTKREVLSMIAKLFDPAGWISPVIVKAKILMQKIWQETYGWDDIVGPSILGQWKAFLQHYSDLGTIKITRWIHTTEHQNRIELHAFSDASERAYAAAVYIRVQTGDNTFSCNLLTSKTRVAPLKTISLPRLELCGALLLAKLVQSVIRSSPMSCHAMRCWSDSTIVLAWISKPPTTWSTFVANRVAEIQSITAPATWSHVDSSDNPADMGSRGLSPSELKDSQLWWHGPCWLSEPQTSWPSRHSAHIPEGYGLERRNVKTFVTTHKEPDDMLARFSSYSRALRCFAFIFRFLYKTRKIGPVPQQSALSSAELNHAKFCLIRFTQRQYFNEEYNRLSRKEEIPNKSSILSLTPFLDNEGILRVGSRLALATSLSYNERYPIILPYNCDFSRLLVSFIHVISLHGENQLMLRLIRTQFWIIRGKVLVRKTIRSCKTCILHKKEARIQLMAALPPSRTALSRPFTTTGIDFAGPFEIRSCTLRSSQLTKGYVCIFVCFATKAIHLEITSDLSSTTFLAAFTRFCGRRGCPQAVFSDNGTNFVGASRTLKREFKEFLREGRRSLGENPNFYQVEWHFIPPGAPHMGGLWESGVRSFKSHFRKLAGSLRFTYEEFATLLCRIESCLNSRPISVISDDPDAIAALTPGHFLVGGPLLAPAEPELNQEPISVVNRWQRVKAAHHIFCQRWKNEYLVELHKRYKWKHPVANVQPGTIVVVKEDNLPANEWRLGRVEKVFDGSDGKVRVVELNTPRGKIVRHIQKLVVLPTD